MVYSDLTGLSPQQKLEVLLSFVPNIIRASKTNETIKHMREIVKGKTIQSQAVVSGISMIENIVNSKIKINSLVACIDDIFTPRAQKALHEASNKAESVLCVNQATFNLLDVKKNSNGLAAQITLEFKRISDIKNESIYIVMDSLELPGNIGTIMRTADGAGLSCVIISNNKVRLNNPTLLAASRAAFANLDIIVDDVENILSWAKQNSVDIVLADTRAENIHTQINLKKKVCFVVGCERYGIDEKWYEKEYKLLKIPMLGQCDSLNVGIAGSILVYEALRQQEN